MSFSYRYMNNIERYAPWADLSLLREKIIEHIRDNYDNLYDEIRPFVSGETPCLLNISLYRVIIRNAISDIYGGQQNIINDPLWGGARNSIVDFFTRSELWEKKL